MCDKTTLSQFLALTTLWLGVFIVFENFAATSNYDSSIGMLQIWQKPEATKCSWQQTVVVAWVGFRGSYIGSNGYFIAAFHDGMGFVPSVLKNATETRILLDMIAKDGFVRYTEAEVAEFRHCYGV